MSRRCNNSGRRGSGCCQPRCCNNNCGCGFGGGFGGGGCGCGCGGGFGGGCGPLLWILLLGCW